MSGKSTTSAHQHMGSACQTAADSRYRHIPPLHGAHTSLRRCWSSGKDRTDLDTLKEQQQQQQQVGASRVSCSQFMLCHGKKCRAVDPGAIFEGPRSCQGNSEVG